MQMKSGQRMNLLHRPHGTQGGTYVCYVPGCTTRQHEDGFCQAHSVPLRLLKNKR